MWGAVIGAAIGAIASHIEGGLNRSHNAKEARAADARSMAMWRTQQVQGPSLSRQGLEEAGYNPMLAISGGLGSSSIPSSHSGTSSGIPDVAGSARQGAEIVNEITKKFGLDNDKTKAETESIDTERRINEMESLFRIENMKTDMELKRSQIRKNTIDSGSSIWDRAFDNPLVAPVAGVLGYKAAEKVGGLLGNSAKNLSKAPIVKAWEAAAKKGAPFLGIGSSMLRGISLPLLIGTSGVAGWNAAKDGKGKKVSEDKYFSHGNWSR